MIGAEVRIRGPRPILVAALLAVVGCFSPPPHPHTLAEGYAGAPGIESLLVLPLNLAIALPSDLEPATSTLSTEIERYLRSRGMEVQTIGYYAVRKSWSRAMEEAKARGEEDFSGAARAMVRELAESRDFDSVVMPNLVYRSARVLQVVSDVIWDGVARKIETKGSAQVNHAGFHVTTDITGKMTGMSLHLFVYDSSGEQIFESIGGLDLAHYADFGSAVSHYQFQLKRRLLDDEQALREGVSLAFSPFLPLLPGEGGSP